MAAFGRKKLTSGKKKVPVPSPRFKSQGRKTTLEDTEDSKKVNNLSKSQKETIARQIQDILSSNSDFTMGKILRVQERIQRIVPSYRRKPDHILVILKEIGEHLAEIESIYKDWEKEGDNLDEDAIDWAAAAEELADVLILFARAIVDNKEYQSEKERTYMLSDLMDSAMSLDPDIQRGQLLLAALNPLGMKAVPFSTRVSSLYYVAQFSSTLPFGVSGLREAWAKKVSKVINRVYK